MGELNIIKLSNVKKLETDINASVIVRRRVRNGNSVPRYRLEEALTIELSNGRIILIPKGFEWDLSSVPRPLWGILPPDGFMELASLVHDYLYVTKLTSRSFADKEMFIWSKVLNGTSSTFSFKNLDNWTRYIGVVLFGWIVWNKKKK